MAQEDLGTAGVPRVAVALSVAGSDPSGGAGVQADLKTFAALGVYGAAALTALTVQNTRGVRAVHPVPADFVAAQVAAVLDDLDVAAVKLGMLGRADVVEALADLLARRPVRHVVLDPVMVATSGDRLVDEATVAATRERLLPLATLVTPNLPEAAALLGHPVTGGPGEPVEQLLGAAARGVRALGAGAVLVKGGHLGGPTSPDLLADDEGELLLPAERVATCHTHGTGCTLSSAIAARLARGASLRTAVAEAKDYLTGALRAADAVAVGGGRGPVHHFHHWW